MATDLGVSTRISIGEESTAGTGVSRTIGARVLSVDLQQKRRYDVMETLESAMPGSGTSILTQIMVEGTVEMPLCYAGNCLGMLLKHAMGSVSTTGAGPYAHAVTLGSSLPAGLTIAIERGTSALDEVLSGCKIRRLVIACRAGERGRVTADFVGMTGASRTTDTPAALSALTAFFLAKHTHCGSLGWNGNSYAIREFTLTIDNNLARVDEVGTAASAEPAIAGMRSVTMDITLISRSTNTLHAGHLAQTAADATLTLTDSPRSLAITLHNAEIHELADPISGHGVIEQRIKLVAHRDDSDGGLAVTLTNADSSVVAS